MCLRVGNQVVPFALETGSPGEDGIGVHNGWMGSPSGPVTLLFTDVEGSVGPGEADREVMAEVSARHTRLGCGQAELAGGRVFKAVGEPFGVVFGGSSVALALAVAVQWAVGTGPWPAGCSR